MLPKKMSMFSLRTRQELKGFYFLLPWLTGFVLFFAFPMVQSVIYSFSNVRITAKERILSFAGFANYIDIFTRDIFFVERLRAFFVNTAFSLPVIIVFSLLVAILINQRIKLEGFFRTLYFLPVIVVSGPVLNRLIAQGATTMPLIERYNVYGLINEIIPTPLIEPVALLFSQLILILWYSGVPILIFLAGLQKIDISLYEAALIDGASIWVVFWKVTLPSIKGIILVNAVYVLVFLATSEINEVINLIKENMLNPNRGFGIASAMAWSYTIGLLFALGLIYMIIGGEKRQKIEKGRYRR